MINLLYRNYLKEQRPKDACGGKKTKILNEWKRVDKNGHMYYKFCYRINDFKTYKTLEKAIKWIEDHEKYPIYH